MAYGIVQIYSGIGTLPVRPVDQAVQRELMPRLIATPGFQRFSSMSLLDNRIGFYSLWTNEASALLGQQTSSVWADESDGMRQFQLAEALQGEVLFSFTSAVEQTRRGVYGLIQIYQTSADAHDIAAALEVQIRPTLTSAAGVLHYCCIAFDDTTVMVSAYDSAESANLVNEKVRNEAARTGQPLWLVLPQPPETMEGVFLGTYIP